ncbi:hypothetical protein TNCV_5062761 [Trichonephila clavipes]|nr:hypothetical protein TNCV_5062761 [Trichonephila clavipes]
MIYSGSSGSPVLKVSDHGWHVMSSSPVALKTRRVGQRCTLNLSRAETHPSAGTIFDGRSFVLSTDNSVHHCFYAPTYHKQAGSHVVKLDS